jgi:hypothetical protein
MWIAFAAYYALTALMAGLVLFGPPYDKNFRPWETWKGAAACLLIVLGSPIIVPLAVVMSFVAEMSRIDR